jgi:predicted ferric reductase
MKNNVNDPFKTWTERLYEVCKQEKNITLRVDGPYGRSSINYYEYSTIFLIGGGIGITPLVSMLQKYSQKIQNKKVRILKKIVFIWTIRKVEHFEWFDKLLLELSELPFVTVLIFTTKSKQPEIKIENNSIELSNIKVVENLKSNIVDEIDVNKKVSNSDVIEKKESGIQFIESRPNFEELFTKYTQKKDHFIGVFSCGPDSMMYSVEFACWKKSISFCRQYHFHKETFLF